MVVERRPRGDRGWLWVMATAMVRWPEGERGGGRGEMGREEVVREVGGGGVMVVEREERARKTAPFIACPLRCTA